MGPTVPLRRLDEVLCVPQCTTRVLPFWEAFHSGRAFGPDVEGKQAAPLLFSTDRPGKAQAIAFHLRKP